MSANILVVDDEKGLAAFMAETLETLGHQITTAHDGEEGKTLAGAQAFDLIFTDLKMPKVSGMELLAHLRATQPEVPVVMITAHGSIDNAVEAMRQGAFDYLQKPIASPDQLRLLATRALDVKRLKTNEEARRRLRGDSPQVTWGAASMKPVMHAIEKVAPTQATVLLTGQSGTGKEVMANLIHEKSGRCAGPFVAVNCATLSESLVESELFGHEKGAFTGATERRRGRIEFAAGGTVFLDEVGELKPELQAKLLRVLQEQTFQRVGGNQTLRADVRWISATNRDLRAMIAEGTFREDLYHRLAVFPIALPPLRERSEDIAGLVSVLVSRVGTELGKPKLRVEEAALKKLVASAWPGNIRELRNVLERAAILSDSDLIDVEHLWALGEPSVPSMGAAGQSPQTLADLELAAIQQALDATDGNRKQAAERLGIGLRTLYEKIKRHDLT